LKLKRKIKKKAKISSRNTGDSFTRKNRAHIIARVQDIAEPLCDGEGIELVHVEFVREPGGRKLRLYVDKPGGVTLDDCAIFSRELSALLDIDLPENLGAYSLEVSSPGSDRPLVKPADFDRFIDSRVKIKTSSIIDGQKNFNGTLMGTSSEFIKLKLDDKTVQIPFQEIARARLNPN